MHTSLDAQLTEKNISLIHEIINFQKATWMQLYLLACKTSNIV